MTLRTKLEDLRKTPSLAPTAAEYRALLELALAVEALKNADDALIEQRRERPDLDRSLLVSDVVVARAELYAALARLAEAVK